MITVCEGAVPYTAKKPVICAKCRRGKIGNISERSEANISRRGKPPPSRYDSIEVKCPVCGHLWTLTIEN